MGHAHCQRCKIDLPKWGLTMRRDLRSVEGAVHSCKSVRALGVSGKCESGTTYLATYKFKGRDTLSGVLAKQAHPFIPTGTNYGLALSFWRFPRADHLHVVGSYTQTDGVLVLWVCEEEWRPVLKNTRPGHWAKWPAGVVMRCAPFQAYRGGWATCVYLLLWQHRGW